MTTSHHVYRPRPQRLPLKRGAIDFADQEGVAAMLELIGDVELPPVDEQAALPFIGVTNDGLPMEGLYRLADESAPTERAVEAARRFLDLVDPTLRTSAVLPIDAVEWRMWTNAFLAFPEHGLLLQELPDSTRQAALAVVAATMGAQGYDRTRGAMRLNGELGRILGQYPDSLGEYSYRFTLFGDPSGVQPWGWQLAGHHIDVHALIIGNQVVMTPCFLGVELEGQELFGEHRRRAREFMASLEARQRDLALLYGSMVSSELPDELAGIVDGRHRAGAGRDNVVLPYVGLSGEELSAGQRELLLALVDPYLDTLPEQPREHRRSQVARFIDQTHLGWIGGWDDCDPFYYRVHSPVLLVEYDNHAGIFLDNDEPEPYHVHTIVRSPNGGDYGKQLLRQHYAQHHHHG